MRIIDAGLEKKLQIGKQGENKSTCVDFGTFLQECRSEFGEGTLSLSHQRQGDTGPYLVALDGARWVVKSADVAVKGTGIAELTYTAGDVVRKSLHWATVTLDELGAVVTPPAAWQGYVDQVTAQVAHVTGMTVSAETATGTTPTVTKGTDAQGNVHLTFGLVKGRDGSDASVTADNIANALGYTPADNAALSGKMDSRNPVGSGHLSIGRKADTAIGTNSVALGYDTSATKSYAIAAGKGTVSSGIASHSEGSLTTASGFSSHAEGNSTTASGTNSHAEGTSTRAEGTSSHAGGHSTQGDDGPIYTEAKGYASFAHGIAAKATGNVAFATGQLTEANGTLSMTGGNQTVADGRAAAAMGNNTHATQDAQFVVGYANNPQNDSIFEVGNGLDADGNPGSSSNAEPATRQNAFRVTQDGKAIAQTGLQIGDTAIDEEALQSIAALPETVAGKQDIIADLDSIRNKANSAVQTETDPTVPDWAKAANKPSYQANEIAMGDTTVGAVLSEQSSDIAELGQLKPETAPSAVGKILKVLSVNDDGTFTCEWADAPSGGSTDVQINGTSITSEGVANIPLANNSTKGVVKTNNAYGVSVDSFGNIIGVAKTASEYASAQNSLIVDKGTLNNVLAAPSIMPELTTTEQANARKRIGCGFRQINQFTVTEEQSAEKTLTFNMSESATDELIILIEHSGSIGSNNYIKWYADSALVTGGCYYDAGTSISSCRLTGLGTTYMAYQSFGTTNGYGVSVKAVACSGDISTINRFSVTANGSSGKHGAGTVITVFVR